MLVDEFHEFFFNCPASIVNGKVVSVIGQLLAAERVIGVSATFRGEAGIKKIETLLPGCHFITSPGKFKEKEL